MMGKFRVGRWLIAFVLVWMAGCATSDASVTNEPVVEEMPTTAQAP